MDERATARWRTRMSALQSDESCIYTSARTEASEHHGARSWGSVLCSLRLRLTDRSGAVLSCLPGGLYLLDWHHAREHGAFDVAASDRRRVGPDNSPRAGSRHAHFAADVNSVSAHPFEIEPDLQLDE